MWKCSECGISQLPRTPLNLKVVKTRQITYQNGDNVTKGYETVIEQQLCKGCADGD